MSNNYHQEVQRFTGWCDKQKATTKGLASGSRSPTEPFIPRHATVNYITRHANRLMEAVYNYDRKEAPATQYVVENCPLVLAILLNIGRGSLIAYFVQHESLYDKNLPFLSKPLHFCRHGNYDFFNEFYQAQWQFCAHVFTPSYGALVSIPQEKILPVTELTPIDQRSSSIIHKITVHHEHDGLLEDRGTTVRVCARFARKT